MQHQHENGVAAGALRTLRRRASRLGLLGVGLLAALTSGCGTEARGNEVITLKLGHVNPPGSLVDLSVQEFVRRVNTELAGRVHIDIFGSGQLGSDEVLMIKLKLGTVDIATSSTVVSSTIPEFGFFEIPYLIRDRQHLTRVEEEVFWPHIAPYAEDMGFKILALWEHGFRHVTSNNRPIQVPQDLAGIKLRTPSGFWRVSAFQAFGANPTPMPLTEVFVALQTGVIDGQENPMHQIYSSRFHEVQRYLSLTRHVYSPIFVTVGSEKWQRHPPEIRAEIERIAREVTEYAAQEGARIDTELRTYFEEHGIQVNEVDWDTFVAASQPVYNAFGAQIPGGREWIDMALALGGGSAGAGPLTRGAPPATPASPGASAAAESN